MAFDKPHAMMVDEAHDEHARMGFVASYKSYLTNEVSGGSRVVYEARVRPTAKRELKAEPDRHEIRRRIVREPFFQMVSSLRRTSQEMIWDSTGECVARQTKDLIDRAKTYSRRDGVGSLRLTPGLVSPRYLTAVDIHCMPGNYTSDLTADDVFAGALYDIGAYQYGMGGQGPMTNDVGLTAVKYLKETNPKFKPKKILDLGCGVGHQTLALVEGFPEAEVYACDLGAPMVRYGHARAETLGKRVHFSQQNAEHTDFADESFDLVTSLILFHETSYKAIFNVMKECYRVLKPGGIMVHGDVPEFNQFWPDPYDQFQREWTTHFNAEPFRSKMRDMDMKAIAADLGFNKKSIVETRLRSPFSSPLYAKTHAYGAMWWVMAAQK